MARSSNLIRSILGPRYSPAATPLFDLENLLGLVLLKTFVLFLNRSALDVILHPVGALFL